LTEIISEGSYIIIARDLRVQVLTAKHRKNCSPSNMLDWVFIYKVL